MRASPIAYGAMTARWRLFSARVTALLLVVLMCSTGAPAYSVLTHEEIVDLLWTGEIRPLLLNRYPGLTEDQIKQAHAYAYGGAVIQDLGYYPFGSKEFSNLVHYVRSGDFVRELLLENRYASQQYHDFIGFQVSKPLLERVFPVVYGVELKDVLTHEDLAIGSYRFAVSRLIPEMTRVALQTHKKDLIREKPDFAKREFLYRLSRSGYEKEWGKDYKKPGVGTRILSTLLRFMPKVGPFKGLGFNSPTPQTEDLYIKSINTTVDQYRALLEEVKRDSLVLPNRDLDTGNVTKAAEYSLTDDTYAQLLAQLSEQKFDHTSPELRENILQFYSDLSVPIETKKNAAQWQGVLKELGRLEEAPPSPPMLSGAAQ